MGILSSQPQEAPPQKKISQPIKDIYFNFIQSNKVILRSFRQSSVPIPSSISAHLDDTLSDLLLPFQKIGKYTWALQIVLNFRRYFRSNFQSIWTANREQFYQLLLINCNANLKDTFIISFQRYFYETAIHSLEQTIPDTFLDAILLEELNQNIINTTIPQSNVTQSEGEEKKEKFKIRRSKSTMKERLMRILDTANFRDPSTIKQEYISTLRVLSCSLLLPETIFIDRLSENSKIEVIDLLKFYQQLSNTLKQMFHSNNLISCPLKHFVTHLDLEMHKKNIKHSHFIQDEMPSTSSQETRRIWKTREVNNNVILKQVKSFLDAYTEFVQIYFQLHHIADSRFGRIVNFEILYGIILKSVWNFVDWILQRGFQYQQTKIQEYFSLQEIKNQVNLSERVIEYLQSLVEDLREEKHPQQYLKKVVLFYRQASKNCENADELLSVYQYIVGRVIKQNSSRRLYLFKMKNVIEKLLNIDESSLNGGEISYSWATWCILIELLREKIMQKYGEYSHEESQVTEKLKKSSLLIEANLNKKSMEAQLFRSQ